MQFNTSTSTELSQEVTTNLTAQGEALSEGGLIRLSGLQQDLLTKREGEEAVGDNDNFTISYLQSTDMLLRPLPYWRTLDDGYNTTNNLLTSIPKCGQLYFKGICILSLQICIHERS